MYADLKKMWNNLQQYNIMRITSIEFRKDMLSYSYQHNAIINYSREFEEVFIDFTKIMLLYEDILKSYKIDDFKVTLYIQNCIILLVTTLESYLTNIYKHICINTKVGDLKQFQVKKFLKCFNVRLNLIPMWYSRMKDISIYNLLPERVNFQNKDRCRNAFSVFEIQLDEPSKELWDKIFSKDDGYVGFRHIFAHTGSAFTLKRYKKLDFNFIEDAILDIAKFIHSVDGAILNKYPTIPQSLGKFHIE
ncbi:hypothetical protein LCGC14_0586940 [marine sediment metagenome]|uniref:RiboL-PSP-HEPN domain-containing protein n=1 Tax=marine sediment metagenome TaxID=412755 RepID=A0A0F9RYH0_9ZZZZ|nr:hypothetical protein [archaeon]HEC36999.1 hypothetical protein [bacterium]